MDSPPRLYIRSDLDPPRMRRLLYAHYHAESLGGARRALVHALAIIGAALGALVLRPSLVAPEPQRALAEGWGALALVTIGVWVAELFWCRRRSILAGEDPPPS